MGVKGIERQISNEELVALIQNGVNVRENMGKLYEQNQNFIQNVCVPFAKSFDLNDLMQEAYFGLVKAVEGYQADKGYMFLTYAKWHIRNACIQYAKNNGSLKRIPVYMQTIISHYTRLIQNEETMPDKQTVMRELKLTEKQYEELLRFVNEQQVVSFDKPLSEEDSQTIGNSIPDTIDLEGDYIRQDCAKQIWNVVNRELDGRKRDVIIQHFQRGEYLTDIAKREGVSTQAVHSAMKEAIKVLSQIDELEEYASEFGYHSSIAYSGRNHSVEFLAIKHIQCAEKKERLQNRLNRNLARLR